MVTFWGIITVLTVLGGIPAVGGLWVFERWRSRRRNRRGECAACGIPWCSTPPGEPYLIHGRLVCQGCAQTARRRMTWHFGFLGLWATIATVSVLADAGLAPILLLPVASVAAMTLGAVQWMKAANRKAQHRIAAGEFPDMGAVGLASLIYDEDRMPQGPALEHHHRAKAV